MSLLNSTTAVNDSSQFHCEICFQSYSQVGSLHSVACLPCGHIFGKNCLYQWLESKKPQIICPKCKKKFNDRPFSTDRFEDCIITIYGLPCNGNIPIEYVDSSDKLFQVERELSEVREENSRLRRELISLRKNFRYLTSQRSLRVPLLSSYTNYNNYSNFEDRMRSYRLNNAAGMYLNLRRRNGIYDYFTRLTNTSLRGSTSNRYTDSVVSNPPSPNNIPEFTISDEGDHVEEQIVDEDSRDTVPSQPDEIVILSDDEESSTEMNDVEFHELNDFNELDNIYSNESSSPQISTVSFTNCICSSKCLDITDAILIDETVVIACRIYRENDSFSNYGLKFYSSKNNFTLKISNQPIKEINVIRSRNNSDRFNILVASSNNLYFVKFHAFKFDAVVSKRFTYAVEITSLTWVSHEHFAFGTSNGDVIFWDIKDSVFITQNKKRSQRNGVVENKSPIVQLRAATHGHVFAVQDDKIYLYHKDSKKSLVKEYNMGVKFIDLNGNKDKLFCILTDEPQTFKIVQYTIVEHIRTERTHLNVEDNLFPQENHYNTTCHVMKSSLFEYTNQNDSFTGFFDYDKNSNQLLVKFLNQIHDGRLGLKVQGEPIKVVVNSLCNRINGSEKLKFAVITNKEVYVHGLNCNF